MGMACLDLYIYIVSVKVRTTEISHFSVVYKKYNTCTVVKTHTHTHEKTYECVYFLYPALHNIFVSL